MAEEVTQLRDILYSYYSSVCLCPDVEVCVSFLFTIPHCCCSVDIFVSMCIQKNKEKTKSLVTPRSSPCFFLASSKEKTEEEGSGRKMLCHLNTHTHTHKTKILVQLPERQISYLVFSFGRFLCSIAASRSHYKTLLKNPPFAVCMILT